MNVQEFLYHDDGLPLFNDLTFSTNPLESPELLDGHEVSHFEVASLTDRIGVLLDLRFAEELADYFSVGLLVFDEVLELGIVWRPDRQDKTIRCVAHLGNFTFEQRGGYIDTTTRGSGLPAPAGNLSITSRRVLFYGLTNEDFARNLPQPDFGEASSKTLLSELPRLDMSYDVVGSAVITGQ